LEAIRVALKEVRKTAKAGDEAAMGEAKKKVGVALVAATKAGVPQSEIIAASQATDEDEEGAKKGGDSSSSSSDSYSEFEEEPLDKGALDKANFEGIAAALAFASLADAASAAAAAAPPPPPPPPPGPPPP